LCPCHVLQAENDEIQKKLLEDDTLKWFKIKSSMPRTLQVSFCTLHSIPSI
jgi:hypothetical protein